MMFRGLKCDAGRWSRNLMLHVFVLFRPYEKTLLDGPWQPSPGTLHFLEQEFGFRKWVALRGGFFPWTLSGFCPLYHNDEGEPRLNLKESVHDMETIRGKGSLQLSRLRYRGLDGA